MVEFALIVIPFLFLILGMIEFGWLFNAQIILTGSAREGARVAAVNGTLEEIVEAVENHIELTGLTAQNINPQYGDDQVTVSVNGAIVPIVGFFVTNDVELSAQAVMRLEFKKD